MRMVEATGDSVAQALRAALATLLDCDEGDLEVHVRGPGVEQVTGRVRIALDVAGPARSGATEEPPAQDEGLARDDEPVGDTGEAGAAEVGPVPSGAVPPEQAGTPEQAVPPEQAGTPDHDEEDDLVDDVADDVRDEEVRSLGASRSSEDSTEASLEDEAEAAADFLEGLLDALDLPGDLRIRVADDEHAEVELVDVGTGALIGRRGQTLEAIQELLRCALQREFQRRARVKVDVEGYRARRLEKLMEKAEEAIDAVLETGEAERLEPMDVFERKAVHHLVAGVDGLESRSQGREPARRVIIEPV
jgi:spoIIIJ-associated protein